ncbi:MAG: ribosomal subunit interface protein [Rhodobiaceae bacterium]|nr:MAG: ribosomal subunit interface protein [Rhodobiaceae bacterium]
MQVQVTGIHLDVGDALRAHVLEQFAASVGKYFDQPVDGSVTFTKDGQGYRADCSVHLSSGMTLQTQDQSGDVYASFDSAVEKLEKRLRRYKRRLKNHHNTPKSELPAMDVSSFVLAPADKEKEDEVAITDTPVIVAEGTTAVPVLSVSDAVMQLDISDAPFVMFRGREGGLNIVYRRADGNIGWIDATSDSKKT